MVFQRAPRLEADAERLGTQGEHDLDEDRPTWMVEAHEQLAIRQSPVGNIGDVDDPPPGSPNKRKRRRRSMLAVLGVAMVFCGGIVAAQLVDRVATDASSDDSGPQTSTDQEAVDSTASEAVAASATAVEIPDVSVLPEGDDGDRMAIRIETPEETEDDGAQGTVSGATATIRSDGQLYFEGAFRSAEEAERYVSRAAEVFGADSIVENYSIDPEAPEPKAANVALDKPVLFERGSAEIHPDYIPFLEACGDVLALNPDITMSISAFTDSTGSEEFNLELSQQRAQAIVDFYRALDIADEQLFGAGFGEDATFGDNETDAGQTENRRAMLQLLNVMADS